MKNEKNEPTDNDSLIHEHSTSAKTCATNNFSLPQFNVIKRESLPASIKKSLIRIERSKWNFHPKYHGKAEFFILYHERLINTSFRILSALKKLLNNSNDKIEFDSTLKKIQMLCFDLFESAENHHQIEDHSYFPAFRKLEPELGVGIDLLENDHKLLSAALADLKSSLQESMLFNSSYSAVGKIYQSAEKVDKILTRHLSDEEEIIIPIFLIHQ